MIVCRNKHFSKKDQDTAIRTPPSAKCCDTEVIATACKSIDPGRQSRFKNGHVSIKLPPPPPIAI